MELETGGDGEITTADGTMQNIVEVARCRSLVSKSAKLMRHTVRVAAQAPHEETRMQYTLLFCLSPEEFEARSHPEKTQLFYAAFMPYMKAIRDAGIYVTGAGLQPPSSATTLRLRNGQPLVQDGPFADTKEQLGGFVVIEVPDLDSALQWAARYPAGEGGLVEVRPNLPGSTPVAQ